VDEDAIEAIVEPIGEAIAEAIADLSLDDAIEVVEGVQADCRFRLQGLYADRERT